MLIKTTLIYYNRPTEMVNIKKEKEGKGCGATVLIHW